MLLRVGGSGKGGGIASKYNMFSGLLCIIAERQPYFFM